MRTPTPIVLCLVVAAAGACANDPVYLSPMPQSVEVGGGDMAPTTATASIVVPVRVETMEEYEERVALATELGVAVETVASVRRDDIELELEWTIKNLDDAEGEAVLVVVGANEFYQYDPLAFIIDPQNDEAAPPLMGGVPIMVPPLGTVSGVFREDELAECAQDLEAITRGGLAPEYTSLTQWETGDVIDRAGVMVTPSRAVPAMLQLDVTLASGSHMVMEYVLRVRDRSDRLDPYQTDQGMLVQPAQLGAYAPPPPMMMP